MRGFDRDDHVQQLLALVVLVAVVPLAIFVFPANKVVSELLWGCGALAWAWYLVIAKGIVEPFAWVNAVRAIIKFCWRE